MTRARDTADGIARAITDGIIVDADINASAAIAQSKVANLSTTFSGISNSLTSKVDYSLPVNTQAGTTYTFVLADDARLTAATSASAKTFTVPPQSSVVWTANDIIRVVNYGAGALTINGGVGVTVTNTASTIAQFQSAAVIRTAENAWTLVPFSGGASSANFTNTATGTYSVSTVNYKYITFTGNGSLVVDKAGYADVWILSGGSPDFAASWNGGAGGLLRNSAFLTASTHTVVVGGSNTKSSLGSYVAPHCNLWTGLGATGNTDGTGLSDSITGTSVLYGRGAQDNPVANRGEGRGTANPGAGSSGVVIVRVTV